MMAGKPSDDNERRIQSGNLHELIDHTTLHRRVAELAEGINRDYRGRKPILIGILKGSFVFMADLIRCLDIEYQVDFMSITGYGNMTEHSGAVRLLKDLSVNITGRPVLIVEDIIDSGQTIDYIRRMLLARRPESLKIMTLLSKTKRRVTDVPIEYIGFDIDNVFVVGYGLDLAERYRGLDYIARVDIINGT
jgi:hypoxanthine phosphoribosyltransferase